MCSDVKNALQNIDIGLVPSYHEEMPFIIIEYLAAGIPVIATEVGDVLAMLSTSRNDLAGWILPITNDKPNLRVLTELMQAICDGGFDLEQYRTKALDAFNKFDINKIGNSYLDFYMLKSSK